MVLNKAHLDFLYRCINVRKIYVLKHKLLKSVYAYKIRLLKIVICTKIGNGPMEVKRDTYLKQLNFRKDNGNQ